MAKLDEFLVARIRAAARATALLRATIEGARTGDEARRPEHVAEVQRRDKEPVRLTPVRGGRFRPHDLRRPARTRRDRR